MFDTSFISQTDYIFGEIFENDLNLPQIFYSKIDHVWDFLHKSRSINNPFVLITHNGDYAVNQHMADLASTIPNLKKWFGQNIDCDSYIITSIPIGLENTKNWTKFSKSDLLYSKSNSKYPEKLIYANFSFYTNPNERLKCYELVKNSDFITNNCTNNVVQDNYQNWLDDVCNHHYVLCPRGNGIDTHRFWETLYLGRIPITTRNKNTKFYEDLPALFVDDWSEINEEMLYSKIDWFSNTNNFDLEKLKMSYWKSKIQSSI